MKHFTCHVSTPVRHVKEELVGSGGVGDCGIFKLRANHALRCSGIIVDSNMHIGETIFYSQGATFDGFFPHICCLFFGVGAFFGVMLLKITVEVEF